MREVLRRFILILAVLFVSLPLFYKGHGSARKGASVAFLPFTSPCQTIRIEGEVKSPGTYAFNREHTLVDVIKLTGELVPGQNSESIQFQQSISSGDLIVVKNENSQCLEIELKTMRTHERLLLGIPLEPDKMDFADWSALPGVGPVLAERIMNERQKYGDFQSILALKNVPGFGEKKIADMKKYFNSPK